MHIHSFSIKDYRKVETITTAMAGRVIIGLILRHWSWLDLLSLLSLLRKKIIDLGKAQEFELVVREFHDGDIINLTYSNWKFSNVIDFTAHLLTVFPETIPAIAKDQEKAVE